MLVKHWLVDRIIKHKQTMRWVWDGFDQLNVGFPTNRMDAGIMGFACQLNYASMTSYNALNFNEVKKKLCIFLQDIKNRLAISG